MPDGIADVWWDMVGAGRAPGLAVMVWCGLLLVACGGSGASAPPTADVPVAPVASASIAPSPPTGAAHIFTAAIDAGHGGPRNVGAVHVDAQGRPDLVERDLNLDVARRLDRLLRADGYRTVMLRTGDDGLTPFDQPDLGENVRRENQARADLANGAGADVLIDIHFNGSDDPSQSGTEVYYDPDRPFGEQSRRLAVAVHDGLIAELRALPYDVVDRGIKDDAAIGSHYGQPHSFLLGENPGFRPTLMPGVIGEALFVSNPREAALLQQDSARDAIARGYERGVRAYFGQ